MDAAKRAELEKKLAQLRDFYVKGLPAEFEKLDLLVARLSPNTPAREVLSEIHDALHKFAGSGGSFGLPELSADARKIEQDLLSWLKSGKISYDQKDYEALCQKIEALKKDLKIDREHEKESAIVLSKPSEDAVAILPGSEKEQSSARAKIIWLIEVDKKLQTQLLTELRSFNFKVIEFESTDTIATADTAPSAPDLIIINLALLDVDQATNSYRLPEVLLKRKRPFIVVGSQDDFSVRLNVAQLGARSYFVIPFVISDLLNNVNQILEKQAAAPGRVLIVDDDLQLACHYKLVLESVGMTVDFVVHPEELILRIDAFKPELVLMDLNMPNISGRDLAGVIRQYKRYASLPIVFLSAETELSKQIDALFHGADEFLTKPISDHELILAVHSRIERARTLESLIKKDGLTGLLTHSNIKVMADYELNKAQRSSASVSFAMLDIDHFKSVNDRFGHAMGDQVISSLAMLLKQRLRKVDLLGRYGGEEFLVILSDCDIQNALKILETIRVLFSKISFESGKQKFSCSISIGIANNHQFLDCGSDELINRADKALYEAKNGGRNKTVLSKDKPI